MKHKSRGYPPKLYTVGTAPFAGGPATLRKYVREGRLGPVPRLPNGTPILYPEHVTRANKLLGRTC